MSAQGISEGQGERPLSVFLSYAREDQARAEQLIAALEASGFKVWWDGLIMGGAEFSGDIERALETADAVVVIWSEASGASHWVRDEAERGRDRGRLVPVTFIGALPPLGFRQIQAVDFAGWAGAANARPFSALKEAIEAVAKGREVEARTVVRRAAGMPRRRMLLAGGGAALASAGGGLGAWKAGWFDPEVPENSIAVLPFKNLSGDKDQDWLADGTSEEIRQELMSKEGLKVFAPASVASAAKGGKSLGEIATMLGVRHILTGSVRRDNKSLRITAELSDSKSGYAVWADKFDRDVSNVFAVQQEIADAVGNALSAQVRGSRDPGLRKKFGQYGSTTNLAAFEAYLKGEAYYRDGSTEGSIKASLEQFGRAIDLDPQFARAFARRSVVQTYFTSAFAIPVEYNAHYRAALSDAKTAIRLAPKLAAGYVAEAIILSRGYQDFRAAWQPYSTARRLARNDPEVLMSTAGYFANMGKKQLAKDAIDKAIDLDPLNPINYSMRANVAMCARDYPLVFTAAKKTREMSNAFSHTYFFDGTAYTALGKHREALSSFALNRSELGLFTGQAIAQHHLGNRDAAEAAYLDLEHKYGDAAAYQFAQILAQWNRLPKAMEKLDLAKALGDSGLPFAFCDPLLDPLRNLKAFHRLIAALGFV